jgi:hypothetical protein
MGGQLDNVKNKLLQLSDVVKPTRNAATVPLRCASIALGKDTEASKLDTHVYQASSCSDTQMAQKPAPVHLG